MLPVFGGISGSIRTTWSIRAEGTESDQSTLDGFDASPAMRHKPLEFGRDPFVFRVPASWLAFAAHARFSAS